jgi:hypothetical protein
MYRTFIAFTLFALVTLQFVTFGYSADNANDALTAIEGRSGDTFGDAVADASGR